MEQEQAFTVTDKRASVRENAEEPSPQREIPPAEPQPSQPGEATVPPMPEASLLTLLFSLYTTAQMCLGLVPDPTTQKTFKDVGQAKYHIDLLEMLQTKTKGNLAPEEEQALASMLYDVRMTYVEVNK
jgi:hypothetical protein